LRELEAASIAKLGFVLVGRDGRIGDEPVTIEAGTGWDELDAQGFTLRLSEMERGAVNVVLQPGHWRLPRVDHLGVALDERDYDAVLMRAAAWNLPVQERGGRRPFVSPSARDPLPSPPPAERRP